MCGGLRLLDLCGDRGSCWKAALNSTQRTPGELAEISGLCSARRGVIPQQPPRAIGTSSRQPPSTLGHATHKPNVQYILDTCSMRYNVMVVGPPPRITRDGVVVLARPQPNPSSIKHARDFTSRDAQKRKMEEDEEQLVIMRALVPRIGAADCGAPAA